jgi:hypothetical protein
MSLKSIYIFIEKGGCSVYPSLACMFFDAIAGQKSASAVQAEGKVIGEKSNE